MSFNVILLTVLANFPCADTYHTILVELYFQSGTLFAIKSVKQT